MLSNKIIWNKHLKWSLFWTLLSIVLTGSSTVWVTFMFDNVHSSIRWVYLGLFLGSYVFGYLPSMLSPAQLIKAELLATRTYIKKLTRAYRNFPEFSLDERFRKLREPWLTSQSRSVIKAAQDTIHYSAIGTIPLIVDIVTMSVLIDPVYAASYIVSVSAYLTFTHFRKNRTEQYAKQTQDSENAFTEKLNSGWDNITANNQYNVTLWKAKTKIAFDQLQTNSVQTSNYTNITTAVGITLASVPILGVTLYQFIQASNAENDDKMILLLGVLPRQLGTLQKIKNMIYIDLIHLIVG